MTYESTASYSKLADAILKEYKLKTAFDRFRQTQSADASAAETTLAHRRELLHNIHRAKQTASEARCFNTSKALEDMARSFS